MLPEHSGACEYDSHLSPGGDGVCQLVGVTGEGSCVLRPENNVVEMLDPNIGEEVEDSAVHFVYSGCAQRASRPHAVKAVGISSGCQVSQRVFTA